MNNTEFQTVTGKQNTPVIVDFWAEWCGPCKVTKPILEKVSREYAGKVDFIVVDADESQEVLQKLRIFGIPTVLAFRDGVEVGRVTGAQNETSYRAMFQSLADGDPVKVPMAPFDRLLRLGGGALFTIIGLVTGSWLLALAGGLLAFTGIYDRCPIWATLTNLLQRK